MATKKDPKADIDALQKQLYSVIQFVYPSVSQKSMQDKVDDCYKQLQKLQKSEDAPTFTTEMDKISSTVTKATLLVEQLRSNVDMVEATQASLALFLSIFYLVENHSAQYDAAISALCIVYSGFFSFILPKQKEMLPVQIHKCITKALGIFILPSLTKQIQGCSAIGKVVMIELVEQHNSSSYPGFDSAARNRLDSFVKLMGELEFLMERNVKDDESTQ